MAEQEEQTVTVRDAPVPGQSRTGRAVALARLLHHECTQLLQLYVSLSALHSGYAKHGTGQAVRQPAPLVGAYWEHEAASYLPVAFQWYVGLLLDILSEIDHCALVCYWRDTVLQSVITLKETPTISHIPREP